MSQSSFTQQRVFIVGDGSLFDEGIMQLLTHGTNLFVSHTIYSDDLTFLNINEWDRPDVILINEPGSLNVERILKFISSHPIVKELLIIVVRLWNSVIDIYEMSIFDAGNVYRISRQIIAATVDDLINVVNSISVVRRKYNDQ